MAVTNFLQLMSLVLLVGFVTIRATIDGDNPNYLEQIFEDREFFAINTMHPCQGLEEQDYVPRDVCQVSALLIRLNSAKIQIQQVISLHGSVTTGCTNPSSSYPHVNNGSSLEEILHSSFDLITDAALNLTIVHNHPLSVISSDVTSGVAEVLCELKRLLNLTPTRHLTTVSKTLELHRQTSQDVTFFTCKTLKNVKKILRHVIRNIRRSRGNSDTIPTYPRID